MAKMLIIDDEKPVRDLLTVISKAAGHDSRLACNGREGIAQFQAYQPDLVITDILMPEKEGIETIAELRRAAPQLPIIAISGGGRIGNTGFLKVAARFGATRCIAKPFSPAAVIAILGELLPKAA